MRTRAPALVTTISALALMASRGTAWAQPPIESGDAGAPPDAEAAAPSPADGSPLDTQEADLFAALPMTEAPLPKEASTGIRGRILDAKTGAALEGAPVLIQDGRQTHAAVTGGNGAYEAALPPGTYTVRSYYDLYHGARIDRIRVTQGNVETVDLVLDPIDEQRDVAIEELEVPYRADTTTAAAQLQLRQAAGGIGEGLGAEQMSQAGASDAGSAASRVVGVTIDGSLLVVRGLGGRYARVLLNGVPIPSTDPDVPGVDLDLFPASVIDSLNLSKTFLPDMPADFAGGVLEIRTVSFPRKFTLEIDASTGGRTQSTFRSRPNYDGGKYDFLGIDDGRRSLPDTIPDEKVSLTRSGPFTPESLEGAGESFRNSWQHRRTDAMPKLGLDLTLGDSIDFGRRKRFGYLVAAGYGHEEVRQTGISRPRPTLGQDGSLLVYDDYRIESGADEVQTTALGTASLDLGADHSLTALSLFNRSVTDETKLRTGRNGERAGTIERWQLDFLARTLWFNQLLGDHRNLFGTRLRLRWTLFQAYAQRDEPDRRSVTYGPRGGLFRWLDDSSSGERFFSALDQNDLGTTASLRFPLWSQAWGTLGGWAQTSGRDFFIRRFRMASTQSDQNEYTRPVEELFSPEGIGPLTRLQEETRNDDTYTSQQDLLVGFGMIETPLWGPLSLAGGVRAEASRQDVASRSPFPSQQTPENTKRTERSDLDLLPGGALKYELTPQMFLRAAYGMTVARPQIRELASYPYYDFLRDRNVTGNPDLERTRIHNADLRWEWFFHEGEVTAVSLFYKKFLDPIELQIADANTYDSRYINAEGASNLGAEAELRLSLGRLSRALEAFSFEGNVAVVNSKVEFSQELSGAVRSERRLFGQAPYVINLSLRFDQQETGLGAALIYNLVGPRIVDVGIRVNDVILPNVEEDPFHSLDLVASWKVNRHFKLKLKARNLLLQKRRLRQSTFLLQEVDAGASLSAGLGYSY